MHYDDICCSPDPIDWFRARKKVGPIFFPVNSLTASTMLSPSLSIRVLPIDFLYILIRVHTKD
jgi:hypothetical protein